MRLIGAGRSGEGRGEGTGVRGGRGHAPHRLRVGVLGLLVVVAWVGADALTALAGEPLRDVALPMAEWATDGGVEEGAASSPGDSAAPPEPVPADLLPSEPLRAPRGGVRTFAPAHARFPVRANGEEVRFTVQAVSVVAGEILTIDASPDLRLLQGSGVVAPSSPGQWQWRAPAEPGIVPLRLDGPQGRVDLTVLVMVPATEIRDGVLDGYRIGRYVQDPNTGNPVYRPPTGFAAVRPEDEDILVSPHFTLGQFLCKDPGDPRYVVLSGPLVLKLEAILEAVNRAGHRTPSLQVMSGFRTPAYNRAIGNTTDLSRHLWGDAADIYIDTRGDGKMDDLNGDGRITDADAQVLARIVEGLERADDSVRPGGLGLYRANAVRGPFVHVDARGTRARW